mmetsp:Transcript_145870/g.370480  ORF Transcript_145870/g.370480 Transcript_145870/m.370480 type:complete len:93 (+) Transcript_145870:1-279(+)
MRAEVAFDDFEEAGTLILGTAFLAAEALRLHRELVRAGVSTAFGEPGRRHHARVRALPQRGLGNIFESVASSSAWGALAGMRGCEVGSVQLN